MSCSHLQTWCQPENQDHISHAVCGWGLCMKRINLKKIGTILTGRKYKVFTQANLLTWGGELSGLGLQQQKVKLSEAPRRSEIEYPSHYAK